MQSETGQKDTCWHKEQIWKTALVSKVQRATPPKDEEYQS